MVAGFWALLRRLRRRLRRAEGRAARYEQGTTRI
jgi:hypothetical protein